MVRSDVPVVCTLTPEALEARRAGLLAELANRSEEYEQITDGIRLRFSATPETLPTITRAVEANGTVADFSGFRSPLNPTRDQSFWS